MTPREVRLDTYLVAHGHAETLQQAQGLIASGMIMVREQKATSINRVVHEGDTVTVLRQSNKWASRAGGKLEAAIEHFGFDIAGAIVLDCGASTGGFTDVAISKGAAHVYAVDVGYGLLLHRLQVDSRVTMIDRTNIRHLQKLPGETPTVVVMDLSFISLRTVLPNVSRLAPGAQVLALFKPQFELPASAVLPGGIVGDQLETQRSLAAFRTWLETELYGTVQGEPFPSPVRGSKGNQEWLIWFSLPLNNVQDIS